MTITVILCTYNRVKYLATALESVISSALPPHVVWEIVVVDNNSGDGTREIVGQFCRRFPNLVRYIFEPQQGLSNARNAGIREARGDIVAFVDDDVTVEPTWLHNLTASLRDGHWAGAGGRVRPPRDFMQPDWLTLDGGLMDSSGVLALFDAGTVAGELKRPPFGANMAFRKVMFEKYGGFRPDLGRCGTNLIGNEDTEFATRLLVGGENLRYEPDAIVYHPVPKERLNQRYFLAWWFAYGRAMFRQIGPSPRMCGIPRPYIRILSRTFRWLTSSSRNPRRRFYLQCRLWAAAGELVEMHGDRRRGKRQ